MKLTCNRDALLAACQIAGAAVAARTTKPILANIKVIAESDALILMGTDLEIGVRYELRGVQVDRSGSAILPVHRLISILRETSDAQITLNSDKETTHLRLSTGKFQLPNSDPDEFPDIPSFDNGGNYQELNVGVLRSLVKRTVFAAEKKESTRWAVTGILWEAEGNSVRLVATDTKRLAQAVGPAIIHGDPPSGQSHLIPVKAIQLLERNLVDDGEQIRVILKSNEAMFQTERAIIYTKLVEGRFPPYRDIIPKKLAVKLSLPVADLLNRVRQAAIMSDEESKRIDFHFEPGKVTLTARGPETGSGEIVLELPDYKGQEVDIAFDPNYMIEALKAIESEPTVQLEMTDGTKPAVFRLGDQYLYLLMPLSS